MQLSFGNDYRIPCCTCVNYQRSRIPCVHMIYLLEYYTQQALPFEPPTYYLPQWYLQLLEVCAPNQKKLGLLDSLADYHRRLHHADLGGKQLRNMSLDFSSFANAFPLARVTAKAAPLSSRRPLTTRSFEAPFLLTAFAGERCSDPVLRNGLAGAELHLTPLDVKSLQNWLTVKEEKFLKNPKNECQNFKVRRMRRRFSAAFSLEWFQPFGSVSPYLCAFLRFDSRCCTARKRERESYCGLPLKMLVYLQEHPRWTHYKHVHHIHTHTQEHTCTRTHAQIHILTNVHAQEYLSMHRHTRTHVHTYTRTHVHKHTRTHVHTHTRAHAHKHTGSHEH